MTPEETREREARELCDELYWSPCTGQKMSDARLDAYASAVEARVVARLVAGIAGLRIPIDHTNVAWWIRMDHQAEDCARNAHAGSWNAALDAVAALSRTATTE